MLIEKRILQLVVIILCFVPIITGFSGAFYGVKFLGGSGIDLDSHFRYLSGLLLGIGIIFLTLIPNIEKHSVQYRILTIIVFIGGLARLSGIYFSGMPSKQMLVGLVIEIVICPLLYLWQQRIARIYLKK